MTRVSALFGLHRPSSVVGDSPAIRRSARALLLFGLAFFWIAAAEASDPPHWTGPSLTIDCGSQCHTLHSALGSQLTQAATNVQLCQSCHNSAGDAKRMPVDDVVKATPGGGGSSHAFDAAAVQSAYGAALPLDEQMKLRVVCDPDDCADDAERAAIGKIICSTCHNQHTATSANGGTANISQPQKVQGAPDLGTGTISSGGTFVGTEGTWYHILITDTGPTPPNFQWRSFVDSNPDGWTDWSGDTDFTPDVPVALADGIEITFDTGTFVATEEFELFASFPFLRVSLDNGLAGSAICLQCHSERDMDHTAVETHGYGVGPGGSDVDRSHPVGVGLNANNKNYDRGAPLDGDGSADDGNAFNTLALDGNGNVHCLTCHGVHNAHSNTLSAGAFPSP